METDNWQKLSIAIKILCLICVAFTLEQLAAATFSYFLVTEITLFAGESNIFLAIVMAIATSIPMFMICGFFSLVLVAFSRVIFGLKFENMLKPPEKEETFKWTLIYFWSFLVAVEIALVTSEYMRTADNQARNAGVDPLYINIAVILWFLVLAKCYDYFEGVWQRMKKRYAEKLKQNHKPSSR